MGHQVPVHHAVGDDEPDADDGGGAQLEEHGELGGLVLLAQLVDGAGHGAEEDVVHGGVGERGGQLVEERGGGGAEVGGGGVPQRHAEAHDGENENPPEVGAQRSARDAHTRGEGEEERRPHGDHDDEASHEGRNEGVGDEREERDEVGVGALLVVQLQVGDVEERAEGHEDQQHGYDHVNAHQLVAVRTALHHPDHYQNDVHREQDSGKREQAVHASREMAVRIHDDRAAAQLDVVDLRVAEGNSQIILALRFDVIPDVDELLLPSTAKNKEEVTHDKDTKL